MPVKVFLRMRDEPFVPIGEDPLGIWIPGVRRWVSDGLGHAWLSWNQGKGSQPVMGAETS